MLDEMTTYDVYIALRYKRKCSAVWKEKATQMRYRWLQDQGRADSFRQMFGEQKDRAEAAEKQVAELVSLLAERDNEAECLGKTAENLAKRLAELEAEMESWLEQEGAAIVDTSILHNK